MRSGIYDYGVYTRPRLMTKARDRPRITYEIVKRIFQGFQRSAGGLAPTPYVYSFRKGVQATGLA